MMSRLLASFAFLAFVGGCVGASDGASEGAAAASASSGIRYQFETKATFTTPQNEQHQANMFALGASAEGVVLLAGDESTPAATYVWNGEALEKRDGVSPRATSSLVFDPATGTTWAIERSSADPWSYEAVWRWQNGAWTQRWTGYAMSMKGVKWSRYYFDTQANALARATDMGLFTWVDESTTEEPNGHWQGRDGHELSSDNAAYDSTTNQLVVFGKNVFFKVTVETGRPGASPGGALDWSTSTFVRQAPSGLALASCDDALFDVGRGATLQLCKAWGGTTVVYEWTPAAPVTVGTFARDPNRNADPGMLAYDVVHKSLVGIDGADFSRKLPNALQVARRVEQ